MTAFTGTVTALGLTGGFHPRHAEVEVEYDLEHKLSYTCPISEAPRLHATVKVTVEVQP